MSEDLKAADSLGKRLCDCWQAANPPENPDHAVAWDDFDPDQKGLWEAAALAFAEDVLAFQGQEIERLVVARSEGAVVVYLAEREDGGLRVWSDDEPGLILSGKNPKRVGADIWPSIKGMRDFRAARQALKDPA